MFRLLGRPATLGRTLTEADVADETNNGVVISDSLVAHEIRSGSKLLGRTPTLDNATLSIVGVMPADFIFRARHGLLARVAVREQRIRHQPR